MKYVFMILGIFSVIYYAVCVCYAGIRSSFLWIWLVMGILFLGLWRFLANCQKQNLSFHLPKTIAIIGICILIVGFAIFSVVEGLIVKGMMQKAPKDLDCVIVLGAQVKKDRVSKALAERLEKTYEYLSQNENTIAILSGGQGPGEEITEAKAMYEYLIEKGIDKGRLYMEDKSTDTVENIRFSYQLLAKVDASAENLRVGIITNNFHVFRGVGIAKMQGYENVYGIPAKSTSVMQLHYLLREFFAIVKDAIKGNLMLPF